MKVIIVKDYQKMSNEAYNFIEELLKEKKDAVLGLATGSSPIGLYKLMVKGYEDGVIDYSKVKTFNLDEYLDLPKEHKQSYYSFMHENLFKGINVLKENINIPKGDGIDHLQDCKMYEELLNKHIIDIQILGIGSNGHIGFNEPGTSFDTTTHLVKLKEKTRLDNQRFFESIDEVPTHAITMGIKSIMKSKKIILLATGKNKAEAIKNMIEGPVDENVPASILQKHDDVVVIIDEQAASLLKK